jgi:uncharacterized peroxidase-related enzyme
VSFLTEADPADATTERFFAQDRDRLGYVANFSRTFAVRPAAYAAWQQLNGAIKSGMDLRRYELATVAAARELRSSYCTLAHGAVLAEDHLPEDTVRELVQDPDTADLDPADRAVVALATLVARDATALGPADFAELRTLGFTDPEILDVVLAAAARCFFSTVLDATGTRPDPQCGDTLSEATRQALTVGRPIAG